MKIFNFRRIGFLIILGVLLPLLWSQNSAIANAATPSFQYKKIEISGTGEVFQLKILNKKANSSYKWSTSDKKIVKVTKNGLITSVNKGSARITCLITYATGKTKYLYCNVTVIIPATEIEINNTTLTNGAHVMMVGESYTFNRTLTPLNSTDQTYWSLDITDDNVTNPDSIRIDDSSEGTVTALRRGKIVLVATAAKESTAEAAEVSEVKDAVIIEVIGPSAEVVSAKITNSKIIKVVFGTAIKESTLVNSSGILSNNITLTRLDDTSHKTASDPGSLTASLSADSKTLTITATNSFNGKYGLTFSNNILTTAGEHIYKDYFELNYINETTDDITTPTDNTDTDTNSNPDTFAPELDSIVLDDDGMTTIITFKEKMDFSYFSASDAKSATNSIGASTSTISFINNEANYSFGSDGKSIMINLSKIVAEDYNKAFTVTISGITDLAGNDLAAGSFVATIRTDNSSKMQARPISVVRTSYDIITATFTRPIKTPGYATINYGGYCYGTVDPDNSNQVNYKLSASETMLTGTQTVSIGHWDSYNVISNDNYANQMYPFSVYFVTENTRPFLISYSFDAVLNILKLTYSEEVHLTSDSGYIAYTMDASPYNNNTGTFYYKGASTVNNVVEIMLNNITLYGDYSFTLPEGFVLDNYRNLSYSNVMKINNGSAGDSLRKLAEPYSIYQSEVNHSFIFIQFADKLDVASAMNLNNFSVSGTTVLEVNLVSNTTDGAIVRLTLAKGTITTTGGHKLSVTDLKGYNGSTAVMDNYSTQINLIENQDPVLSSIKYDAATKNTIILTFTENITGSMTLTVKNHSTGITIGSTVAITGTTVTITLSSIPADGSYLDIYVQDNKIKDLNGNESTISPILYTFANY